MNKLYNKFLKLNSDSKFTLRALSLVGEEVDENLFTQSILNVSDTLSMDFDLLAEDTIKLIRDKFILVNKGAIRVNPEISELVVYELSQDKKEFSRVFELFKYELFYDTWRESFYQNFYNTSRYDYPKIIEILDFCLSKEFISSLPNHILKFLFKSLIFKKNFNDPFVIKNIEFIFSFIKEGNALGYFSEEIFFYLLFTDNFSELEKLLPSLNIEYQASYYFLLKDFAKSKKLFSKFLKGTKPNIFQNSSCIFYSFLTLKEALDSKDQKAALIKFQNYLTKESKKSKHYFYSNILYSLGLYIDYSLNNKNDIINHFESLNKQISNPKEIYNYNLFLFIIKFNSIIINFIKDQLNAEIKTSKISVNFQTDLFSQVESVFKLIPNFLYFKEQIRCSFNKDIEKETKSSFLTKNNLPVIVDFYKIEKKWLKDYEEIQSYLDINSMPSYPEYRFIVEPSISENQFDDFDFYIQKLNSKKTGYLKHKYISLDSLYTKYLSFMDDSFKSIVNTCISRDTSYYYLSLKEVIDKSFLLNLSKCNLCIKKKKDLIPVKLNLVKPTVILEKGKSFHNYKFKLDFKSSYFVKKKDNLINAYFIDTSDLLNKYLVPGVKIPNTEVDKVNSLALSISNKYKLTTKIDIDESQEILSDSKITVIVEPENQSFIVSFFVTPLSNDGYQIIGKGDRIVYFNTKKIVRSFKKEKSNLKDVIDSSSVLTSYTKEILKSFTVIIDDHNVFLLLLSELRKLKKEINLLLPDLNQFKLKKLLTTKSLSLAITAKSDLFSIEGEVAVSDDLNIEISKILELLDKENKYIKVNDDNYYFLSDKLAKYLKRIKQYSDKSQKSDKSKSLTFNNKSILSIKEIVENLNDVSVNKAWEEKISSIDKALKTKYKEPSSKKFKIKLRDYQKDGIKWMTNLSKLNFGALLADDMGLGKTIQTLGYIINTNKAKDVSIVIAPKSVSFNWQQEAKKFCPNLKTLLVSYGGEDHNYEDYDLVILSYGLLKSQIYKLKKIKFKSLILDESQYVKNVATQRFQNVLKINAENKIALSGTPIENSISELWSILRIINPGLLGTIKEFNNEYAIPITRYNDIEKLGYLTELIKPFVLRRTKVEVLKELPPKVEKVINIDFTKEEQAFYNAVREKALTKINSIANSKGNQGSKHIQILAEISKLRQSCCSPKLILGNQEIKSSKLIEFSNIVDNIINSNDHKLLVFSQFVKFLNLAKEELDSKQVNYCYLDGSTSLKKRQQQVELFQNSKDNKIFLISLKAGGSGLNLTAADYVLHLDPWWNPAVEDQASDRAHRIGQKKSVNVYKLIINNSIESQIIKLHKKKKDLADSIINNTSSNNSKLNINDLINLIN